MEQLLTNGFSYKKFLRFLTDMKTIRGADEWWLCILLGESYETEFQSGGGVRVYDGNCDDIKIKKLQSRYQTFPKRQNE